MISFIIPTYNSAKTIGKAIDSIINQKKELDREIVIIDDGSTDETEAVIEKYKCRNLKELKGTKIKYYKKQNEGVASARNYGVQKAEGEYIIFVDSDDYVSNNLILDIEPSIKNNIELIKWNPIIISNQGKEINKLEAIDFELTNGEDGFNKLYGTDPLIDGLWNYAIKKSIMLKFPEGTYHEDFATMPLVIIGAKSMISLNKYEYYYVQTPKSIMRGNDENKQRKKLEDIVKHYDSLIKKSNEMNISKYTKENLAIFVTNSLLVIMPELDGENKKYFKMELKKRKIARNIKLRNFKQILKRILLTIKY